MMRREVLFFGDTNIPSADDVGLLFYNLEECQSSSVLTVTGYSLQNRTGYFKYEFDAASGKPGKVFDDPFDIGYDGFLNTRVMVPALMSGEFTEIIDWARQQMQFDVCQKRNENFIRVLSAVCAGKLSVASFDEFENAVIISRDTYEQLVSDSESLDYWKNYPEEFEK